MVRCFFAGESSAGCTPGSGTSILAAGQNTFFVGPIASNVADFQLCGGAANTGLLVLYLDGTVGIAGTTNAGFNTSFDGLNLPTIQPIFLQGGEQLQKRSRNFWKFVRFYTRVCNCNTFWSRSFSWCIE